MLAVLSIIRKCLLCLTLVLTFIILLRTLTLVPPFSPAEDCRSNDTDYIGLDQACLQRFKQAIRYPTVSIGDGTEDRQPLSDIISFIQQAYPHIHSSRLVVREVVANYSLLYTIQGSQPSLKPYMLMGHLDVVPESAGDWHAPAFSADVLDGYIYGRGTIDNKHQVFGILEALEFLLQKGHEPKRSFYLAFGHDEEIGGFGGAKVVGELLAERGVKLEYILDEGLTVTQDIIVGMSNPAALIGTSEKGYCTVEISVNMKGGHSSMPDKESAIGVLAKAVAKLEANRQPIMFGYGPEVGMLQHLASEMNFAYRMIMSNLWIFSPVVTRIMSGRPSSDAVMRTTTAVTMFNAGIKDNVISPTATAIINHRIHPAQSVEEVIEYDKYVIDDPRVEFTMLRYLPPLPQSPYTPESFGYQTIATSIRQIWGQQNVAVAPGLMIGNTDTRHYSHLTANIYRFAPTFMYPDDVPRFHGLNERISTDNYEKAMNFFYHILVNSDKESIDIHGHNTEL